MTETTTVVVGRLDIHDRVVLNNEAPTTLDAPAGGDLHVKLLFNYAELSSQKDDFRVALESTLSGLAAPPSVHSNQDRRGLYDDQQGYIMQRYRDLAPGDHLLTFVVKAEHTDGDEREEATIDGQVMIIVD